MAYLWLDQPVRSGTGVGEQLRERQSTRAPTFKGDACQGVQYLLLGAGGFHGCLHDAVSLEDVVAFLRLNPLPTLRARKALPLLLGLGLAVVFVRVRQRSTQRIRHYCGQRRNRVRWVQQAPAPDDGGGLEFYIGRGVQTIRMAKECL